MIKKKIVSLVLSIMTAASLTTALLPAAYADTTTEATEATSGTTAATVTVGTGGNYATFEALMKDVSDGNRTLNKGDIIQLASDVETGNATIPIPAGYDLKLDLNGYTVSNNTLVNARMFKIEAGAKVEVYGNGSMNANNSWGVFDIYGELEIKDGTYTSLGYTPGTAGGWGASLRGRQGCSLIISDGVTVYSAAGAAVDCDGYAKIGAATLKSSSNNQMKDTDTTGKTVDLYAYCAQFRGGAELNNTTVIGVQGGLFAGNNEGGDKTVVINGGTYKTVDNWADLNLTAEQIEKAQSIMVNNGELNTWMAFYGVYVSNAGRLTINDGEFSSQGSSGYCLLNSDNDTGKPLGNPIKINGGTFNGKVGSLNGNYGTEFINISGGRFKDITTDKHNLGETLAKGYRFAEKDGYYEVVKAEPVTMGESQPFYSKTGETVSSDAVGRYFTHTESVPNATEAKVVLSSTSANKTIEKTLSLPTITGGTVSIRLLVLGAPDDVTGTIILE